MESRTSIKVMKEKGMKEGMVPNECQRVDNDLVFSLLYYLNKNLTVYNNNYELSI